MADTTVMDPPAAGKRLGVNTDTLKRWRRNGTGPAYVRIAVNRVRYRASDLDAWLDAHTVVPTGPGDRKGDTVTG